MTPRVLIFWVLLLPASHSITSALAVAQVAIPAAANTDKRLQGIELYRQRKFSEASKVLKNAVKVNQADDEAWFYLGMAFLAQSRKSRDAEKAFAKATQLRPGYAPAHTGLAYALLGQNKLSEASAEGRAALSLDPSSADAHFIVGVARLRLGDPEEAVSEARAANRLNPELPSAYLLKSQALLRAHLDRDLGLRRLTTAPVSPPTAEERARRAAKRLKSAAVFKEASESLRTYLRLNPNDSSAELWREQLETLEYYGNYSGDKTDPHGPLAGDQVTTKARVLGKPEPSYTEAARQAQVTGTVVLRAIFSSDGKVRHILVVSGLPHGLTEATLKAARKIKFVPATVDGRPVSMFIQLEYNFNLY